MPLFELSATPSEQPDGLEIQAIVNDASVRVLITRQAINAIQLPGTGSCLERFSANRGIFLKIAAAKWNRELVEADGRVYVTLHDVEDPELSSD